MGFRGLKVKGSGLGVWCLGDLGCLSGLLGLVGFQGLGFGGLGVRGSEGAAFRGFQGSGALGIGLGFKVCMGMNYMVLISVIEFQPP